MKVFQLVIWVTIFGSVNANASLQKLSREFLATNKELAQEWQKVQHARLDKDSTEQSKPWQISAEVSRNDNNLESSSGTDFNRLITNTASLEISKGLWFGTQISLSNEITKLDQSRFSSVFLNNSPTQVFEFNQSISLSQDLGKNFFGRQDKLDLAMADLQNKLQERAFEDARSQGLLQFINDYLLAQYNKVILDLENESLKRVEKRESLVKKWVRDGLRQKVDLYQAQASTVAQSENVTLAELKFKESLQSLSSHLHRPVLEGEVGNIITEGTFSAILKGNINTNPSLRRLDGLRQLREKSLKKSEYEVFPEISLSVSYGANEFDPVSGNAVENGLLGNTTDLVTGALTISMPIGMSVEKNNRSKDRIALMTTKKEIEKVERNLHVSEAILFARIRSINQNIQLVERRKDYSAKSLSEYNRLYKQGRTNIDQVIRAEEDYIRTEKSYAQYILDRERSAFLISGMYGNLEETVSRGAK